MFVPSDNDDFQDYSFVIESRKERQGHVKEGNN